MFAKKWYVQTFLLILTIFLKEIKNQETAQLSQIISNLLLLAILIKEFVE